MTTHRTTIPRDSTGPLRVIGYVRVSTDEQADSGAGLAAQRSAIESECERRGWDLVAIHEDAAISGKSMANRHGLGDALTSLADGNASALVVAKLDRLSRSLTDAAALLARSAREGWRLVALDLGVDTTTPQGEVMAHVMAAFAQFERRLIGERTRDALSAVRSRGVTLGRPRILPASTVDRIVGWRADGRSLTAIADALTDDGVPTAHSGARWYPSTVAAVLRSAATTPVPVTARE